MNLANTTITGNNSKCTGWNVVGMHAVLDFQCNELSL